MRTPFLLTLLLACTAGTARADTFDFTFGARAGLFPSSPVTVLTGTLTTSGLEHGTGVFPSYTITGIHGVGIVGLLAPNSFQGNDNLIVAYDLPFFPPNMLDSAGVAFTELYGGTLYDVNFNDFVYPFGPYAYAQSVGVPASGNGVDAFESLTEDAGGGPQPTALTPEPSSVLLMGTGILSALSLALRKERTSV